MTSGTPTIPTNLPHRLSPTAPYLAPLDRARAAVSPHSCDGRLRGSQVFCSAMFTYAHLAPAKWVCYVPSCPPAVPGEHRDAPFQGSVTMQLERLLVSKKELKTVLGIPY